jgi:hypothetical protein
MWYSIILKIQSMYTSKFRTSKFQECFTTYEWGIMYMMYQTKLYFILPSIQLLKINIFLVWFQIIIIFQDET